MPVREIRVSLWRRDWFWALLLIAFVFIAYAQVFRAGFIWDDESHLTRNPCVIGPLGLKEIWTTTQAVYYPLVLTTFWALHKFVGLNPLPYHALNVLLHAVSAILLWRVLRLLEVRGAWLGAALWALHPVMVQSVAWVTELKNTQSCVFYLLSILFFLKWEDQGGAVSRSPQRRTGDRRSLVFALSLLFFLLATLSKPSVVMLPFVLALCVWWMRGKIRWRDALALAPFALISVVASAWTIWEQRFHARAVGPDWVQTFLERLIVAEVAWITELKNTQSCLFYLLSILWFLKWQNRRVGATATSFELSDLEGAAHWGVGLIASVLCLGDAKQTFRGNVALRARALHLVDARKNPLARCAGARSICPDFGRRERVDDLGTEISRTRHWSGLGPNLSGTSDHRW